MKGISKDERFRQTVKQNIRYYGLDDGVEYDKKAEVERLYSQAEVDGIVQLLAGNKEDLERAKRKIKTAIDRAVQERFGERSRHDPAPLMRTVLKSNSEIGEARFHVGDENALFSLIDRDIAYLQEGWILEAIKDWQIELGDVKDRQDEEQEKAIRAKFKRIGRALSRSHRRTSQRRDYEIQKDYWTRLTTYHLIYPLLSNMNEELEQKGLTREKIDRILSDEFRVPVEKIRDCLARTFWEVALEETAKKWYLSESSVRDVIYRF